MRSTTLALVPLLALALAPAARAQCNAQTLSASDAAAGDEFGGDVHLSGDVAIVGAGDEDEGVGGAGSAYVFRRSGLIWVEEQKLARPTPASNYHFGQSVSIDGDVAVCGVPDDDDFASKAGSVDVFRKSGASWVHEQRLTANDAAGSDRFGWAVDVQGSVIVVGAKFDDDVQSNSGSVYVFRHDGASWVQEEKLTAPDAAQNAQFGDALALDGNSILVGAWQDDDAGFFTGGAYVYVHDGASWVFEQKLNASDQDQFHWFGRSVGIHGDIAVCGAYEADVGAFTSGAAYVFRRNAGVWTEVAKLSASDTDDTDNFGWSVDCTDDPFDVGDRVVVGSRRDAAPSTETGSVYAYVDTGSGWQQTDKIVRPSASAGDQLGASLAMDGDLVLAGAVQGDTGAGLDAGLVFAFAIGGACIGSGMSDCDCTGTNSPCFNSGGAGRGCPNSHASGLGAMLNGIGIPDTSNDSFGLQVLDAAPNKPGLVLSGTVSLGPFGLNFVPDSAGLLCVGGTTRRGAVVFTDANGNADLPDFQGAPYGASDIVGTGVSISYTYWFRDPGTANGCITDTGGADFNFSNGWTVLWL